jgi:hypothetical protein
MFPQLPGCFPWESLACTGMDNQGNRIDKRTLFYILSADGVSGIEAGKGT